MALAVESWHARPNGDGFAIGRWRLWNCFVTSSSELIAVIGGRHRPARHADAGEATMCRMVSMNWIR